MHSDTIFGAILSAANQLYRDNFTELVQKFNDNDDAAPFLVSSAYPYLEEDGDKIRFYPKPILKPVKHNINQDKIIKKVNYVQENLFKTWISSEGEKSIINQLDDYHLQEGLLLEEDLGQDFAYQSSTIPRNTINRVTNASENIFYSSGVSFRRMGLFFLVRFIDEEYKNLFEGSIRFLRDRGFGGDISVGKGQFDYEIAYEDPLTDEGNRFLTLSRYCPTSSELSQFNNDLWYELGSKRGRSADGSKRKEFKFFREGSSFPKLDKKIYGRIVKVASQALEYGLAYNVGVS